MRQNGIEAEIMKQASNGTVVFGVCGGYQILGRNLSDPFGVEAGGDVPGMNLLPVETIFAEKKRTIQIHGHFGEVKGIFTSLSNKPFHGYEIHSGVTNLEGGSSLTLMQPINEPGDLVPEGAQNMAGKYNVCGSYCHGIFDGDGIAITIVEALLTKKGMKMDDIKTFSFADYKKQQYDILADYVRAAVDMKQIYTIIEEGV